MGFVDAGGDHVHGVGDERRGGGAADDHAAHSCTSGRIIVGAGPPEGCRESGELHVLTPNAGVWIVERLRDAGLSRSTPFDLLMVFVIFHWRV